MATRARITPGQADQPPDAEIGQVLFLSIDAVRPSPKNQKLYRPVDPADPEVIELAKSIRTIGVLDPLVVSRDNMIVSGHRRLVAARLAGLTELPCRRVSLGSNDPQFLVMLREHNRQRDKTSQERVQEELVSANPEEAYRALTEFREEQAVVDAEFLEIDGSKQRARITDAKGPFLAAIEKVLQSRREFWPLSDRQVHYALLNDPPLTHASKPDSRYRNDSKCYKSLCDLLTRARLARRISITAIADETRPVTIWDVHQTTRPFVRKELDGFLKGFYRDLLQTQPNHIELVCEKNTVAGILRPVAGEYRLPLTSGRGFCSLPPRFQMAQRYAVSGKDALILLVAADFDPDGEQICQSFARSMRDDFRIRQTKVLKVALTYEQTLDRNLPSEMEAKEKSPNYAKFVEQYGTAAYELEALDPSELQDLVREAIDSVLDLDRFNEEIEHEKQDAAELDVYRQKAHAALQDIRT